MLDTALVNGLALPFAAAAIAAGGVWLLARLTGATHAPAGGAGAAGMVAGFAAGLAGVLGWPQVPPTGAVEKLPWLAPLGLLAGVAATRVAGPRERLLIAGIAAGVAVLWLGWPRLAVPHTAAWARGLLIAGVAAWVLARAAGGEAHGHAGRIFVATLAAAAIGLYGSSYAMAQVVGVLAATLAGAVTVAGWRGGGVGPLTHLAAGVPLVGLVTILALYTQAEPLALALLAPVLLADTIRDALFGPAEARPATPLAALGQYALTAGVAVVPAGVAVLVAVARSGPLYY